MTATAAPATQSSAPAPVTQAQPAAPPGKPQGEAEQAQGEAEPSIRDKLIAKVAEKRTERERGADGKFQPKAEKAEAKPGEQEKVDPEKAEGETDEPIDAKERHEFRARMRKFHKWAQKTETQLQGRAQQIQQAESQVNELLQLAERDPVEFLRKKGKDLREILLKFTQEDSKDPVLKRAEEAERLAKEAKDRLDAAEREKQESTATERANNELREHYAQQYREIGEAYPLLRQHSASLGEVAEYARREAVDHYQRHGTELDPHAIFGILERRLKAYLASKQTTSKEESPDRVRTVARSEAVNPETSRRRSADVSPSASRINSETQVGKMPVGYEARREATKARLVERVRELRGNR